MSEPFDPYYKWLGIPPEEQPPNYYRLLAIRPFENDADVIDAAAEQRMTLLRNRQTGRHAAASQKLLNEISTARGCLLDEARRREYDAELKRQTAETPLPEPVVRPAAVEPLSSPLDDLPFVDQSAAASPPPALPLAADTSRQYHSGRYAPRQPVAPALVIGIVCAAILLLVVVLVVGVGVGLRLLAGQSDEGDVPAQLAPVPTRTLPPASPTPSTTRPPPTTPTPPSTPTPKTPPAFAAIDLLERIDPARDSVTGAFRLEDGALLVPEMRVAQLEIPDSPPANYRFELTAERLSGTASLNVCLVSGDAEVAMVFDAFQPKVSGLNLLNGRSADRNATRHPGSTFDDSAPHHIVCTVRPGAIHVTCDGQEVVDWQGDTSQLRLDQRFWKIRHPQRLRIICWASSFRIRQLRLTELPDA